MGVFLVAVCQNLALGQATPSILEIDVANLVEYQDDISDVSKMATNPNVTTSAVNSPVGPHNFFVATVLGDIVAVNGQPVKGTYAARARATITNPTPTPGQAIADTARLSIRETTFEILQSDGTQIGAIMVFGVNGGPGSFPPGAPSLVTGAGSHAIVGGVGAFLGARGQMGQRATAQTVNARAASMAEDPANRRINGGGRVRFVLQVLPMSQPQIVATPSGPAVTHSSDFSLVSPSKPAAAGEILSLFATGLGPTRPSPDPGQPFPASPLAVVNSPIEVMVNGEAAEVLGAVGYPGAVGGYQVNFRLPPDTPKGSVTILVSAAWITGSPVSIPVQ
jgi:uncharacterized protein (TIGR03437 family)